MKRYIRSTSLTDVLNNPEYRHLVDRIEELESDIEAKGVSFDDDSEFLVRAYHYAVADLEAASGYKWNHR